MWWWLADTPEVPMWSFWGWLNITQSGRAKTMVRPHARPHAMCVLDVMECHGRIDLMQKYMTFHFTERSKAMDVPAQRAPLMASPIIFITSCPNKDS
jgi:hypothetical protein